MWSAGPYGAGVTISCEYMSGGDRGTPKQTYFSLDRIFGNARGFIFPVRLSILDFSIGQSSPFAVSHRPPAAGRAILSSPFVKRGTVRALLGSLSSYLALDFAVQSVICSTIIVTRCRHI